MIGIACLLSSIAATVQNTRKPPPTPDGNAPRGSGKDHQAEHLTQQYGLSAEEAAERPSILREVQKIVEIATAADPDSYGGLWVDREPVFKIVLAFAGQDDRKALPERIPPRLRRDVQLRSAAKPLKAAQQETGEVLRAVEAAKLPFETWFDPRSQNHVLIVNQAATGTVRALIPAALRSAVRVRVGPVLSSFQTNVRTGDQVCGGWDLLNSAWDGTCTYGFAGRDSNGRTAILTAAHCGPCTGSSCYYAYMPIDRVNDKLPFPLHTTAGLVAP
jgi:hypothetical protein